MIYWTKIFQFLLFAALGGNRYFRVGKEINLSPIVKGVWPGSVRFILYPTYKWCYGFDLSPLKTIGFLLSWWWSIVLSCMTLKHTVRSLSRLHGFCTKWCYSLSLWNLALKDKRVRPFMMMINCTKLNDPEVYGSVYIPPTRLLYKEMLQPWPLTSDLWKQWGSCSHDGDQLYQVA
jgi:hypothetical protein